MTLITDTQLKEPVQPEKRLAKKCYPHVSQQVFSVPVDTSIPVYTQHSSIHQYSSIYQYIRIYQYMQEIAVDLKWVAIL